MPDENQPQSSRSFRPFGIGLFWFTSLLAATALWTGCVTLPDGLTWSAADAPAGPAVDSRRDALFHPSPLFDASDTRAATEAVPASTPGELVGRPLEAPDPAGGDRPVADAQTRAQSPLNDGLQSGPELSVQVQAREPVEVDETVPFRVKLENATDVAARNVLITCRFDAFFEFPGSRESVIRQPLGTLVPGESRTLALSLTARQIGTGRLEIQVSSSTHAAQTVERRLEIQAPAAVAGDPVVHDTVVVDPVALDTIIVDTVALDVVGPRRRTVGSRAEYVVTLINTAGRDLPAVGVAIAYDPALLLKEVSAGAECRDQLLRWDLGTLFEDERVQIQVEFDCASVISTANLAASVTTHGRGVGEAEGSLTVAARPELELRLADMADPLERGGQSTFLLEVLNHATEPARNIVVHLVPSPNIEIIGARVRRGSDELELSAFVEGNGLYFQTAPPLEPGGRLSYEIEFKAGAAGRGELRALLQSERLAVPLEVCEPIVMNPPPDDA